MNVFSALGSKVPFPQPTRHSCLAVESKGLCAELASEGHGAPPPGTLVGTGDGGGSVAGDLA